MIYKLIMRNCETGVQSRPLRALAARRWSRALVSLPIEAATWPPACTNEKTRALCDHIHLCDHLNHLYMSVLHLSRLRNYLWCLWCVNFPGVRAGILQTGKTIYKMTFWDLKNCTVKLHRVIKKLGTLQNGWGANQVHLKWMTKMKLIKLQSLQSLPHVEIKLKLLLGLRCLKLRCLQNACGPNTSGMFESRFTHTNTSRLTTLHCLQNGQPKKIASVSGLTVVSP